MTPTQPPAGVGAACAHAENRRQSGVFAAGALSACGRGALGAAPAMTAAGDAPADEPRQRRPSGEPRLSPHARAEAVLTRGKSMGALPAGPTDIAMPSAYLAGRSLSQGQSAGSKFRRLRGSNEREMELADDF